MTPPTPPLSVFWFGFHCSVLEVWFGVSRFFGVARTKGMVGVYREERKGRWEVKAVFVSGGFVSIFVIIIRPSGILC